jgi:NADH-quinone oxidoreductase subunit A
VNFELLDKVFPLAITLLLALSVPAAVLLLARFLAVKKPNETKLSPYECGIQSTALEGDARHRFNVKFYLLAMCFLVFDVEIVFLFPWAVLFQKMSWGGFGAMASFLGVLTFGWFYLLKRGALEWE